MNSLQIQDVFAPYYAGREEADVSQTFGRPALESIDADRQPNDRSEKMTLIGGRRRSIRSVSVKGL